MSFDLNYLNFAEPHLTFIDLPEQYTSPSIGMLPCTILDEFLETSK